MLFKVETVGDKYMAVSGLPEPCTTHARNIGRLALDMMDLGKSVILDGKPVVSLVTSNDNLHDLHYCFSNYVIFY